MMGDVTYMGIDQGKVYGIEKIVYIFSWSFWASWIPQQGASSAPELACIPDRSCRTSSFRKNIRERERERGFEQHEY